MAEKTKKVWTVRTVETRHMETYLNDLETQGATVFTVLPSITVSGSAEILSFKKVGTFAGIMDKAIAETSKNGKKS